MKEITSHDALMNLLKDTEKSYLLLWKRGSGQSECAFSALSSASAKHPEVMVLSADVTEVRDIHPQYGISSVPGLLQFEGQALKNVVKGCHQESYFSSLLEEAVYQTRMKEEGRPSKTVIVYSTPACSWCNTLKQWLRKNHIHYTDIDVSRDETAARELMNRTGQQGVPQTEINGQVVVGFDQVKLKQLLEI